MKISVFGLGYVGAVSAGCFTAIGHECIGVDPVRIKIDLVNGGKAPVVEKDLDRMISDAVRERRLRATNDSEEAVFATDISMVCVGTPSRPNGDLDTGALKAVSREIGEALRKKDTRHTVVIRSTVLPGTVGGFVIPVLEEASGKRAGIDFGIGNNPEFLREGTSVHDFYNPPRTVIGAADAATADQIAALYSVITAPLIKTSIEVAEMVKYTDNVWHALKISFANEIGCICKKIEIDSHEVMRIFCQDTKLNLSAHYLKPGFSFGGSCLPKDIRALTHKAKSLDLDLPVLNAIIPSNNNQTARGIEMIMERGKQPVSVLGMSFKAGTDDLRESPILELIERLLGKGFDIRIFDRNVNVSKLVGANREYLLRMIPHVSSLLVDSLDDALAHGKTIVIGNDDPEFRTVTSALRADQFVVDLVCIPNREKIKGRYDGVAW
jgi:GDP-mannose 6-dehydrogenase